MPADRFAVLAVLADVSAPVTAAIGRLAGLDRGVARRALQDLEVIGVVGSERIGDEPTDDSRDVRPTAWSLVGEEDALIRKVFAAPLHDLAERGANRARGLDYDQRQQVAALEALSAGPGRPKSRSGAPR